MMSYINETDFVIENKELVYPEIITDGLQLYYDAKGKRDTDYHRDTMLDMSGNKNHGKLHNFSYEKHSGYKDGLVFDYIDDKLVRPDLNTPQDNFTFQLNGNIISFSPDGTVKLVRDGEVIERKGINLIRNGNFWNGTEGWTTQLQQITARNGKLEGVVEDNISRLFTEVNIQSGHKYYFRMDGFYFDSQGEESVSITGGESAGTWVETFSGLSRLQSSQEQILSPSLDSDGLRWNFTRGSEETKYEIGKVQLINLTTTFGAGNEPTLQEIQAEPDKWQWLPNPLDLIEAKELKGNILGDMENIIDGLYKTEVLSGEEIYTDKSDDSVVHVEVDGKSYQHTGSGKNVFPYLVNSQVVNVSGKAEVLEGKITLNELDDRVRVRFPWDGRDSKIRIMADYSENGLINARYYNSNGALIGTNGLTMTKGLKRVGVVPYSLDQGDLTNARYIEIDFTTHSTLAIPPYTVSNIMVTSANDNLSNYEPPSPTPDYPIEIHSLNDFDVVSSERGRNLIPNSKVVRKAIRHYVPFVENNPFKEGEKITVSYDVKTINGGKINHEFYLREMNGNMTSIVNYQDLIIDGDWKRVYGTVVIPSTINKSNRVNLTIRSERFMTNDGEDYETAIRNIKVEKGNIATDWTPAPEDILEDDNHPFIDKINFLLDEPLRSVGDVKDRLFRDSDGIWKIERNIWGYKADGSEDWVNQANYDNRFDMRSSIGADTGSIYNALNSHFISTRASNNDERNVTWIFGGFPRVLHHNVSSAEELKSYMKNEYDNGTPVTWITEITTPRVEVLSQSLQDKLNNLRSFQDSNHVYTVLSDKDNTLNDNHKPTLHAQFLYSNWYKEDRVINNLMIYNRALTNEEMLQNYKTIKRRWGM